mgnify:CR=1 FL=1
MKKIFLLSLGTISLVLGCLGIFLPLLPTTPFLLLSAFCFSKSSEKYIRDYQEKKGVTLKNKIIAISILVISITFSLTKISSFHLKLFLILVLFGVSCHILRLKTLK